MEMEPTDTSIVAASGEGRGCLEKLGTKNAAGAGEYYGGKPVAVEYPETIQEIMVTLLDPIGLDIHPFLVILSVHNLGFTNHTLCYAILK